MIIVLYLIEFIRVTDSYIQTLPIEILLYELSERNQ